MIAAAQPCRGSFGLRHQQRGAMATDIVERPQDAVGIAHHEDGFAGYIGGKKRPRLRDGTAAADVLPGVAEDGAAFEFVQFGIGIPGCWNGMRPFQRPRRIELRQQVRDVRVHDILARFPLLRKRSPRPQRLYVKGSRHECKLKAAHNASSGGKVMLLGNGFSPHQPVRSLPLPRALSAARH